jgi:AraC-like DNA-binding protein
VLIAFVDAESELGAALAEGAASDVAPIPPATDAVSLDPVAASVGLSPSRFLHLFTTSVGVPLRPYALWLRLQCRARELAGGKSVADAAHAAGFSDAAHFTRTFRRMIGATPRQVLQRGLAVRDFHLKD